MTEQKEWFKLKFSDVFRYFNSSQEGLSENEILERRNLFGKNLLPKKGKVTLLQVIIRQFLSPLIYVLVGAAFISFLLQEYADAIFILIILFVNALIGTIQEWKAESSAEALQEMVQITARVIRNGVSKNINGEELVPGDIVLLESGNKIPADMRLFEVNSLLVEESILTGESVAIEKHINPIISDSTTAGDQKNMVFAGTIVTSGRAKGIVTGIANATEIGKIAESIKDKGKSIAPLVARMEAFSKKISVIVLVACTLLGIGGYYAGFPLQEIFFFVVAIAVSAIPEGLPISMTVALSTGSFRMSKRNVIIRKLSAVEGLGSCTMISTDKTGTLTVDQQTVRHIILSDSSLLTVSGQGYNGEGTIKDEKGNEIQYQENQSLFNSFLEAVTICNEGSLNGEGENWKHEGDAVDVALLALAYKSKTNPNKVKDKIEIVKEIPFESARKYAAVYYKKAGELHFAVKGAAEVLLDATGSSNHELSEEADKLAAQGFRYIAVAGGQVDEVLEESEFPPVDLLGFVALIDPPREEVKDAIDRCHQAGVEVCMITGDHPATALAIAKDLHIATNESELITGVDLAKIGDVSSKAFQDAVLGKHVFARVSPDQKLAIVQAQQKNGHFVAVTGDGVNDAPALKNANMGVAMGYGTDVTKEVSSIIITDNNFASIVAGIEEGRYTYGNIRKIIYLLISTGAAELIMIALALVVGTPLPFLPAQILWLNLVTNGIQDKVLAFEKGEKRFMQMPPKDPKEGIFNRMMIEQVLLASSVISLLTFGLWYHLINHLNYEEAAARNTILLLMVLLQNFHVLNCRSETTSFFKLPLRYNPWLFVGIIAAQGVHILAMQIPVMQNLLQIAPVNISDWGKLFATAILILIVMEIYKLVRHRKIHKELAKE